MFTGLCRLAIFLSLCVINVVRQPVAASGNDNQVLLVRQLLRCSEIRAYRIQQVLHVRGGGKHSMQNPPRREQSVFSGEDDSENDGFRTPDIQNSETDEFAAGFGKSLGASPMAIDSQNPGQGYRTQDCRFQSNTPFQIPSRGNNAMRRLRFGTLNHDQTAETMRSPVPVGKGLDEDDSAEESILLQTPIPKKLLSRTPRPAGGRNGVEQDRVNTFAIGDKSPIAALPPGSAGRCGMSRHLTTNPSFYRDFFDIKEIGHGEHGTVYSCVKKIDLWPYAVKVMRRGSVSQRDRERILQEIYAMASQGDNPHAVRYYSAWEEGDVIYIQTELCLRNLLQAWTSGVGLAHSVTSESQQIPTHLLDHRTAAGSSRPPDAGETGTATAAARRQPLPEGDLWRVVAEVATGLEYMHAHGMAHQDVKPANMYVSASGCLKLGDFGHARTLGAAEAWEAEEPGDRRYASPEVVGGEDFDPAAADMFALGASVYELGSSARLPTAGPAYHALREGAAPRLAGVSSHLVRTLHALLHPDPARRLSAAGAVAAAAQAAAGQVAAALR